MKKLKLAFVATYRGDADNIQLNTVAFIISFTVITILFLTGILKAV